MFIKVPYLDDDVTYRGIKIRQTKPHAVVRLFKKPPSSTFRRPLVNPRKTLYSHLVQFGKIDEGYYIIPCEHICETALVVPNVACLEPEHPPKNTDEENKRAMYKRTVAPLGEGYFVIEPKFQWGEVFGDLIESYDQTEASN